MNLCFLYENGIGVEKNDNKAKEYYDQAVKIVQYSRYITAGYYIGKKYFQGNLIGKNYAKAYPYFEKAAPTRLLLVRDCLGRSRS